MCGNYVFCVVFDCWMTHDGRWCCQTMSGTPGVARVMQLLEDGDRLRVIPQRLYLPQRLVNRLQISYRETRECRPGQGRSRMITPMQYRYLVLLSRCNHMSTAKTLEIDFCHATEVYLPDQIVRYRLHYDVMRARRPAQGPVLTAQHRAVRFNFARQHHNWQSRLWRPVLFTY